LLEKISAYRTAMAKPETDRSPFEELQARLLADDYDEARINTLLEKLERISTKKEEEERTRTPGPIIRRFLNDNHITHLYNDIQRIIDEKPEGMRKFTLVKPALAQLFAAPT